MKALSVRQPWAWLIVNGHKSYENRDWTERNYGRRFRGLVLIHASLGMTKDEYAMGQECAEEEGIILPAPEDLQRGGIVGQTEVMAWHDEPPAGMPFAFSSGLELANSKPLPFQPCKGALGFFNPPTASI